MIFPRSAKFSKKVEKSKGGPLKSEIFDHFEDRVFIKNPEISEFANLEGMGTGDRGPGTGDERLVAVPQESGENRENREFRNFRILHENDRKFAISKRRPRPPFDFSQGPVPVPGTGTGTGTRDRNQGRGQSQRPPPLTSPRSPNFSRKCKKQRGGTFEIDDFRSFGREAFHPK